ncbi:MAG: glycosyltransferase family 1 protein [Candidatus Gracilibacteria bacterium]|nr:glycosyltransferase family 1 protein [Candidatus Gracilibacteria bacterium]MDD5178714.1 glycosyltransferase family 1 protein [Candidatus Gracilibacteria bacterium]
MRIGIDARMYSSGFTGIGRYTAELIRNLAQIDKENEYIVFLNSPEFEEFEAPAENFHALKVNAKHYSRAEQTDFRKALNAAELDLMHFTHFNAPILYSGKSVVTIHDLTLSKYPGQKMNSWLHRLAYNLVLKRSISHATRIITPSRHTKHDLMKLLGVKNEKIEVIYNGVGKEFLPATPNDITKRQIAIRYGVEGGYLLYTGVWRNHKNLLGLLAALHEMRVKKNFTGQLVITGKEDSIYAPEIFATVKDLGLEKSVVFTGLVSDKDLLFLYQNARVFVFPSFYEGFGLPPLEAMSCGIPVAASDSSSIPEILGSENANFFNPDDVIEMAEKIWEVWDDEALRAKLKEKGLQRVAEFSWKKMSEETLTVYQEALGLVKG